MPIKLISSSGSFFTNLWLIQCPRACLLGLVAGECGIAIEIDRGLLQECGCFLVVSTSFHTLSSTNDLSRSSILFEGFLQLDRCGSVYAPKPMVHPLFYLLNYQNEMLFLPWWCWEGKAGVVCFHETRSCGSSISSNKEVIDMRQRHFRTSTMCDRVKTDFPFVSVLKERLGI